MVWRIEVVKLGTDPRATLLARDVIELGFPDPGTLAIANVYFLDRRLARRRVVEVAGRLLADPVSETFAVGRADFGPGRSVDVLYNPGVMDPAVGSIERALASLGITGCPVKTGTRYHFRGPLTAAQVDEVGRRLLYNPLIQHVARPGEQIFVTPPRYRFRLVTVPLRGRTGPELDEISERGQLSLSRDEMLTLQCYYGKLERDPTDIELETFAQTWSEHCKHKTFRGTILARGEKVEDLLGTTVFAVTRRLRRPWCLSVFADNSGVVDFDRGHALTFKVETHNHPSALEPYGGAATGIGGVIRDCLGTGLGATPILNTDVFCFAPPDTPADEVPAGVLHPRRVMKGVVAGVRDYGNRMGIPTASGALVFHPGFIANPLVYCGTLGLIPRNRIRKRVRPGARIILLGGRTGRDGIHGVTFASAQLTEKSETVSSGAVQIGNPIEEKKLLDAMLEARDAGLIEATTDCGGGGLSSAVGELAATGAEVELARVPLKYQGLSYTEIWISEAQERMICLVAARNWPRFARICRRHDVEATAIGRVTDTGGLVLRYQNRTVGRLDLNFLHHGWPRVKKVARFPARRPRSPRPGPGRNPGQDLLALLATPTIASKDWVVRQYDHEVQGRSVVKPFTGTANRGPSDAVVVRPLAASRKAAVISCGICPRYGLIDPYWMAAAAIDEAARNLVAVGGSLARTAVLDNFCWGSPDRPEQLGGLVRAARACRDVGLAYGLPFISGKDSLYNDYRSRGGRWLSIPPTLLISALSVIDDFGRCVTMDIKAPDSWIYLVGTTRDELGGSAYYELLGGLGATVPRLDPTLGKRVLRAVERAIGRGMVRACHDLSEGGLGVALAEMASAGTTGVAINLARVPGAARVRRPETLLFSESNSRFLIEVAPTDGVRFERLFAGLPAARIGTTQAAPRLEVAAGDRPLIDLGLAELADRWQNGLTSRL